MHIPETFHREHENEEKKIAKAFSKVSIFTRHNIESRRIHYLFPSLARSLRLHPLDYLW